MTAVLWSRKISRIFVLRTRRSLVNVDLVLSPACSIAVLLTYWSNSNPTPSLVQNVKQIVRKQFIAAFETCTSTSIKSLNYVWRRDTWSQEICDCLKHGHQFLMKRSSCVMLTIIVVCSLPHVYWMLSQLFVLVNCYYRRGHWAIGYLKHSKR